MARLQYAQLAYLLSNLASLLFSYCALLAFLILCYSLFKSHFLIVCACTTPEFKCVAVIGEFAGDIGISFKVDMDFVCFVDGVFR